MADNQRQTEAGRRPHGRRGLKQPTLSMPITAYVSPPSRAARIETTSGGCPCAGELVAALTGGGSSGSGLLPVNEDSYRIEKHTSPSEDPGQQDPSS